FRGFDLGELAGFFRISFFRTLGTGAILLFFAYPLIGLSEAINQRFFGGGSSKQSIVEFFSASRTIEERIMIIVFAVAIAPIVEEFFFRFFIYGVLKRYVGVFLGVILSALLFAAAHAHFPSFVPLFVLGSCFAIAYQWSGSILVSMTMHSLFNSLTLTALAFPEIISQLNSVLWPMTDCSAKSCFIFRVGELEKSLPGQATTVRLSKYREAKNISC